MAIQEPINDSFYLVWILKVPVSQTMERTFLTGIGRKIQHAAHNIEECLIYLSTNRVIWCSSYRK